jgi:hypothetical protein
VRLLNEIVAVPARVNKNSGVTPAALSVNGPDAGTRVFAMISGTVTGVSPCGAATMTVASALPSTLVALTASKAKWTMESSTVPEALRTIPGTFPPTTTESGAFAWIWPVIATLP